MSIENISAIVPVLARLAACVENYQEPADMDGIMAALTALQDSPLCDAALIAENKRALVTDDWAALEQALVNDFFPSAGLTVVVSPYRVWRPGVKTRLSLLACEKMAGVPDFPFDHAALAARYGAVDFTPIVPVRVYAAAGNIGGTRGESFVVPTAWTKMPALSVIAPVLDMNGAQQKVERMGADAYLRALCDADLAQELIDFRDDVAGCMAARYQEYTLHEYGHAVGCFVDRIGTISSGMWQAALEEWRCDGIMAQLVTDHVRSGRIDADTGRRILMSNFTTRFGMDIVRNDGKKDHDFIASYLILSCLMAAGVVSARGGRICFDGDVRDFQAWEKAYSTLALQAGRVSRDPEGSVNIVEKICSIRFTLDDFSALVVQALRMPQIHAGPERANDNDEAGGVIVADAKDSNFQRGDSTHQNDKGRRSV